MALAKKPLSVTPSIPQYTRGDVINDKYKLLRLLGEGGTSWVWVAENLDLAVEVAIKLIRSDLEDATIGERLLGEARSIARLTHPAIVRVFDFGTTQADESGVGDRFIVMELLQGHSLSQRLHQSGPIPPVELVQLMLPIIDGLSLAHSEGIVHRDLKPDNIMMAVVAGSPQPKLLDFGIAKFAASHGVREHKLTQVGVVVGTPSYMSPEQARGDATLDHRSDLFSLMTVMYECLTGSLPFQGDVYNAVMWSIIQDAPSPLIELGVDAPELWEILERGLAKNPADRWQTARELGGELAGWLELHGVSEDLSGRSLRTSWNPTRTSQLPPVPVIHSFGEHITSTRPSGFLPVGPQTEDTSSSLTPWNSEDQPWQRPNRARRVWLVGGTLAVAVAALLVFLLSGGDEQSPHPSPSPSLARIPGKPQEVSEPSKENSGKEAETLEGSGTVAAKQTVEIEALEELPVAATSEAPVSRARRRRNSHSSGHPRPAPNTAAPNQDVASPQAKPKPAKSEKPDPFDFGF